MNEKMKRKHRSQEHRHQIFSSMTLVETHFSGSTVISFKHFTFWVLPNFLPISLFPQSFFRSYSPPALTASELLTFRYATLLQTEKQSLCTKLLPSLEIARDKGAKALCLYCLASFWLQCAHQLKRRRNYGQKKINVSNHAGCNAQHDAGGPAGSGRKSVCGGR